LSAEEQDTEVGATPAFDPAFAGGVGSTPVAQVPPLSVSKRPSELPLLVA
jgi:hypothetical protein